MFAHEFRELKQNISIYALYIRFYKNYFIRYSAIFIGISISQINNIGYCFSATYIRSVYIHKFMYPNLFEYRYNIYINRIANFVYKIAQMRMLLIV